MTHQFVVRIPGVEVVMNAINRDTLSAAPSRYTSDREIVCAIYLRVRVRRDFAVPNWDLRRVPN
jgi:hypothetical protein